MPAWHIELGSRTYVSANWVNIDSNLSHIRFQAITSADLLAIGPLGIRSGEILSKMQNKFCKKNAFRNSVCRLFIPCSGTNALNYTMLAPKKVGIPLRATEVVDKRSQHDSADWSRDSLPYPAPVWARGTCHTGPRSLITTYMEAYWSCHLWPVNIDVWVAYLVIRISYS